MLDIIDDVKDFWFWVHSSLPSVVAARWPHISLDLDRVAVSGESAGGFLALESALLVPSAKIKVVMAQYPGGFDDVKDALAKPSKMEAPAELHTFVDTYLAGMKPGAIRLKAPFPESLQLFQALSATGRSRELRGMDEKTTLRYGLRVAKDLPPLWIAQGTDDSIVSL